MEASEKEDGSCLGHAFLVIVVLLGMLYLWGLIAGPPKQVSRVDRIRAGCEREFPNDTAAQQQCFVSIVMAETEQEKRGKLERAAGY